MKVQFLVAGLNLDKFILSMHGKNIELYDLKKIENFKLNFRVSKENVKLIKDSLNKHKLHYEVYGEHKIHNILTKFYGVLIGIVIFCSSLIISTRFIWRIEVYGTENLSKSEVIQVLKEHGVSIFKSKSNQNLETIEGIIKENFEIVSEVSSSLIGTTLIINISEKQVFDEVTYLPICASSSGIVKSYKLVSGTMAVVIGEYVNQGDILVYPFIENLNGEQVKVQPICEVSVDAVLVHTIKTADHEVETYQTGKVLVQKNYYIGSKMIFQKSLKKQFAIYDLYCYTENISTIIPLKCEILKYYERATRIRQNDLQALQDEKLSQSLYEAINMLPDNCNISSKSGRNIIIEGVLYSTTTIEYQCIIS